MEYIYNSIKERDIDMLLTTALSIDSEFAIFFIEKTTKHTPIELISVSVSESTAAGEEAGENDVTVLYNYNGDTYCLLIEDKINANLQPKQAKRYYERAKTHYSSYKGHTVCLFCPEKYLENYKNATQEDANEEKFNIYITYEECIDFYEEHSGDFANVAISQLNLAINKNANNTIIAPSVNSFSKQYIELAESDEFNLKSSTNAETSNGYWIQFPVKLGKYIMHKVNKNEIDWTIGNSKDISLTNLELLVEWLNENFDLDSEVVKTGKSYSIRSKNTAHLNHNDDFERQKDNAKKCLEIIKKMTKISNMLSTVTDIQRINK